MNQSNERFTKLLEDFENFKADSAARDQKYDALAKTVKTQLSKTLFEINDRHKKEMGAMQRFETGLRTTKQHEKIILKLDNLTKDHAKRL